MASSPVYRGPDPHQSNSQDNQVNQLRSKIRESRWIQPEQWLSPEIQGKFENVSQQFEIEYSSIIFVFLRDRLILLKS